MWGAENRRRRTPLQELEDSKVTKAGPLLNSHLFCSLFRLDARTKSTKTKMRKTIGLEMRLTNTCERGLVNWIWDIRSLRIRRRAIGCHLSSLDFAQYRVILVLLCRPIYRFLITELQNTDRFTSSKFSEWLTLLSDSAFWAGRWYRSWHFESTSENLR